MPSCLNPVMDDFQCNANVSLPLEFIKNKYKSIPRD